MKKRNFNWLLPLGVVGSLLLTVAVACSSDDDSSSGDTSSATCGISTSASGDVITTLDAVGTGGGTAFDGTLDTTGDLADILSTAYGEGNLGLHRGHAPIESVLIAYLGISHESMHVMMEDCGMNLGAVCESFGFDPENLIDTLTASFDHFLEEGVTNGVITSSEVDSYSSQIRTQFSNRVYWDGN